MAERNLTDADVTALSEKLGKVIGKSQSAPTSGAANFKLNNQELNLFDTALKGAGKGAGALKEAYDKVAGEINQGLGTWRDLSKTGISFGNDVIGMGVAAKGARVDLGDFASTIKDNQVLLAGFGGGISAGAKEFAELSKKMFDAGESTDSLRQLGYTNKELNDVLALQATMIGSSMRKGQERDDIAIKSATSLAYEMDLMAKLTGKSRQEQMESAKKLQADAAFQAKLAQQLEGLDPKEAAERRTKIMEEYTKAEAIGLGQVFKETFTYGQVMTKEAATTQTMANRAGLEAARAAQASAAGNFEESNKRLQNATEESIKNNQNAAFRQTVIYGQFSGAAGEAAQKLYMSNKAQEDAIALIKKEQEANGKGVISNEEARKILVERARAEQDTASGSTKAALNVQQRMNDVSSAIANSLVGPLNKDVNPALNKLADAALGARSQLMPGAKEVGFAKAIENPILAGRAKAESGAAEPKTVGEAAGYGATKFGKTANETGVAGINTAIQVAPKKFSYGTMGVTGKLFEDFGSGTLAELHGLEAVVRPEDMKNIFKSSFTGVGDVFKTQSQNIADMQSSAFKSSMPDLNNLVSGIGPKSSATSAIDMRSISESITTSFSSVIGDTSKTIKLSAQELGDMTAPFSKSFADFNSEFSLLSKDSASNMSDSVDEFGENFDDVVAKMAIDLKDAMPVDAIDQTAAALEYASKRRQELEDIMNDGMARSGAEWDEIFDEAEQLDGQIERLTAKQIESMSNYNDSWGNISDLTDQISADIEDAIPVDTEFGDLEGAIARNTADDEQRQAQAAWDSAVVPDRLDSAMSDLVDSTAPTPAQNSGRGPIDINSFTLGKNGLPIAKPKSAAAAVPDKPAEKTASPGKKINPETGDEYTPVDTASPAKSDTGTKKVAGSTAEKSTLDDVVKALTALNTKVNDLIRVNEEGHKQVARAAKANSSNIFER